MDCNQFVTNSNKSIILPTILLPWNEISPPPAAYKFIELIENFGGKVKKLNFMDQEIDSSKLKLEVDAIFLLIEPTRHIARSILKIAKKGNYPEIAKIIQKVNAATENIQALLLPGGEDVRPFFYGQELGPHTFKTDDYRRDIFEFALLDVADAKNLPILGICRGLQVANIWYGGTLKQHVDGHSYIAQKYHLIDHHPKSVISDVFKKAKKRLTGYSIHHQAADRLGQNLKVIIKHEDGTIKALEHEGSRFIVLLQWHPERILFNSTEEEKQIKKELSEENKLFFKHFIDASRL